MPSKKKTFAHCNHCCQETRHIIQATCERREMEIEGTENSHPVFIYYTYEFLQCFGCDAVTMRSTGESELYGDNTDVEYFPPAASRRRPTWTHLLPSPFIRLMREVYLALHSDSRRLAMMGARTLVDMAILEKVGDVGSFFAKLKELEKGGFIGTKNREVLAAALDAGSAAAHRGHEFKAEEVNQVIDIVENLLQAIFVLEKTAEAIKKATPPRKKRKGA
jgi:hypothetical protein